MKRLYAEGVEQFVNIVQTDKDGRRFIDFERDYSFRYPNGDTSIGKIHSFNRPRNNENGIVNDVCLVTKLWGNSCEFAIGILPRDIYFMDTDQNKSLTDEPVAEEPTLDSKGWVIIKSNDNNSPKPYWPQDMPSIFNGTGYEFLFFPVKKMQTKSRNTMKKPLDIKDFSEDEIKACTESPLYFYNKYVKPKNQPDLTQEEYDNIIALRFIKMRGGRIRPLRMVLSYDIFRLFL